MRSDRRPKRGPWQAFLLAGCGIWAAGRAEAACPYGSIQARVQLNVADPWKVTMTLPQRETFRVGAMHDGSGQFASDTHVTLEVTAPNGGSALFPIGSYVTASMAGTYTVRATCQQLTDTAFSTVQARPRYIYGISPGMADTVNYAPFRKSSDRLRDAGATATHLSFNWDVIEPTQGVRNWMWVEKQVLESEARGLAPFAYTGSTPNWALAPIHQGKNAFYPPQNAFLPQFQSFHRELAQRYCGRVRYYEFWNEPNNGNWMEINSFDDTKFREYIRWLRYWYDAMKDGCKSSVLAVGGFDCHKDSGGSVDCGGQYWRFYELLREAGSPCAGRNCFDAISIHPYDFTYTEGLNWSQIEAVRSVMSIALEEHKLLWLDEWAIDADDSSGSSQKSVLINHVLDRLESFDFDYVFQARYLQITDVKTPQGQIVHRGLIEDNLTPRPSFHTFCKHVRSHNTHQPPSDRWRAEFYQGTTPGTTPLVLRDQGTSPLNINWTSCGPICDNGFDNFSARFTRTVNLPAGTYRFTSRTDDGVRMWLDNNLLIDHWQPQGPTVYWADRAVSAGNHTLKMEYFEQGGGAIAQLWWPRVPSVVCANQTTSTACSANAANGCAWYSCANLCMPTGTPVDRVCACVEKTSSASCGDYSYEGCAWYGCRNKCLPAGTSTYQVCGFGD